MMSMFAKKEDMLEHFREEASERIFGKRDFYKTAPFPHDVRMFKTVDHGTQSFNSYVEIVRQEALARGTQHSTPDQAEPSDLTGFPDFLDPVDMH